jgi:hypothetical protein
MGIRCSCGALAQNVRWKIIIIKKRDEEVRARKKAGLVPLRTEFRWFKTFHHVRSI